MWGGQWGVGTGKGSGKSMRTHLSQLPFSKLPFSKLPFSISPIVRTTPTKSMVNIASANLGVVRASFFFAHHAEKVHLQRGAFCGEHWGWCVVGGHLTPPPLPPPHHALPQNPLSLRPSASHGKKEFSQ